MQPDSVGIHMESEIRRLKMALLQQQLEEKLQNFRAYIRSQQNTTTTTQAPVVIDRPFESILFAPVVGVFEVWHFVILILIAWFFLIVAINYLCKLIQFIKSKYCKNDYKYGPNFQQFNNEQFTLEFDITKSNSGLNGPVNNKIQVSTLSYPPSFSQLQSTSTNSDENLETAKTFTNAFNEFDFDYNPPKSDFFLYTIAEHQMLTKKTFGYKKKLYNSFMNRNLSKSDSNISANNKKTRSSMNAGGPLENKCFEKSSVFV